MQDGSKWNVPMTTSKEWETAGDQWLLVWQVCACKLTSYTDKDLAVKELLEIWRLTSEVTFSDGVRGRCMCDRWQSVLLIKEGGYKERMADYPSMPLWGKHWFSQSLACSPRRWIALSFSLFVEIVCYFTKRSQPNVILHNHMPYLPHVLNRWLTSPHHRKPNSHHGHSPSIHQ